MKINAFVEEVMFFRNVTLGSFTEGTTNAALRGG